MKNYISRIRLIVWMIISMHSMYCIGQVTIPSWQKGLSSSNGIGVAADDNGNVYAVGNFSGTATFGAYSLTSVGNTDLFIVKYNRHGVVQWAKRMGGKLSYGNPIALSGSSIYITGHFSGTINFNTPSSSGSNEITSIGANDILLAKYDTSGIFQWAKRLGGTGEETARYVSASGNSVCVAGTFTGTANFNTPSSTGSNEITTAGGAADSDGFVAKFNDAGIFQWARRFGGAGQISNAHCVAISSDAIYVAGQFAGTANFNNPSATGSNEIISAGNIDNYVAKFSDAGDFLWARRAGGTGDDAPNGLAVSGTSVYMAGGFNNTANFNTPSATGSNEITWIGGYYDTFLAKYNDAGVFQWARRAGTTSDDYAWGIAVADTSVYIAGFFEGISNFNTPSVSGINEITSAGDADAYVAKYNDAGVFRWAKRAGGSGMEMGMNVAVAGNAVYLISRSNSNLLNFNTPSSYGTNVITLSEAYGFVAQYLECVPPTVSSNSPVCAGEDLHLTSTLYGATYSWTGPNAFTSSSEDPIILSTTAVMNGTYSLSASIAGCVSIAAVQTAATIYTTDNTTAVSGSTISANQSGASYQWLDCDNAITPILGATNQSYTPTLSGNYAVLITAAGCPVTSGCVSVAVTSLNQSGSDLQTVGVRPNPSEDFFMIQSAAAGNYKIVNEVGEEIKTFRLSAENNYEMRIENLSKGIYVVVGIDDAGIVVGRGKIVIAE